MKGLAATVLVAAALFVAGPAPGQDTGGGTLGGVATDRADGTPIAGATILLTRVREAGAATAALSRATTSDAGGRFEFSGLPEGDYQILADADGYWPAQFGQRPPWDGGVVLSVGPGAGETSVDLVMTREGVIAGRVADNEGNPVVNARVGAFYRSYNHGELRLLSGGGATTNDLGEYRMFGLRPNEYLVVVSPPPRREFVDSFGASFVNHNGPTSRHVLRTAIAAPPRPELRPFPETYQAVYAPGTTVVENASVIDLRSGEFRIDVDITVGFETRPTVSGTVVDVGSGEPVVAREMATQTLVATRNETIDVDSETGAFWIRGLDPGLYALTADGEGWAALSVLQVGADPIADHRLLARGETSIPGQVLIESTGDVDPALLQFVRLRFHPGIGDPIDLPTSRPGPDGAFTLDGVLFGLHYRPMLDAPWNLYNRDAYVASIRMGEIDVLEDGLLLGEEYRSGSITVVIRTDGGRVEGAALLDGVEVPAVNVPVALVPADLGENRLDYRSTRSDAAGRFLFRGVRPGAYLVYAWESAVPGSWENADFLRSQDGLGVEVTLDAGERREVRVRAIR